MVASKLKKVKVDKIWQAKKNILGNIVPFSKKRKRVTSKIVWWTGLFLIALGIFSYLTNPFVRFSIVNDEISQISYDDNEIKLSQEYSLKVKDRAFYNQLAFFKSGWHIITSKFSGGRKASRSSVDQIISEIHIKRFDPNLPFIISGDHFSVFYNRSLGIFYHSLLDQRTALSNEDWINRQLIYTKSLLYALDVYSQTDRLSTTIVPIGPHSVALLNIYAYPSDTLYSLLYAIAALKDDSVHQIYNYQGANPLSLDQITSPVADSILNIYRDDLIRHVNLYLEKVVDPQTKLVKKDIHISSTKDLVKRESSFYDNVIMWKTLALAADLGIVEIEQNFLPDLKNKIINTFWLPEENHFLDHLSQDSIEGNFYSSDWLIAFQTGFLDPKNQNDLVYLVKSVEYIKRNAIDRPFGVSYQAERRPSETHLLPRLLAPDYGSRAIWSNWGMEYTKLLLSLAQVTKDITYLTEADHQISAYAYNIRRYRGYPEVYTNEGDFYRQFFYKSIRQTGWVVSFEQARAMLEWTKLNWNSF